MTLDLQLGSKCLAYHGPLLYEALIIKRHEPRKSFVEVSKGDNESVEESNLPDFLNDQLGFYIHYKGWKLKWDEWVDETRVMTLTPENVLLQKELKQATLKPVVKEPPTENTKLKKPVDLDTNGVGSKKRKHQNLEPEEEFLKRPEISISIPDILKSLLVDDWEFITKENQLVALPAEICVKDVLQRYVKFKGHSGILDEIIEGLILYFNRSLPSILLYKFERLQYLDVIKLEQNRDKDPLDIYGPEHLLRLFVSLPGLMAQTSMDQQSITVLKDFLEDIMKYMLSNEEIFFKKNYENTTPAYESMARG